MKRGKGLDRSTPLGRGKGIRRGGPVKAKRRTPRRGRLVLTPEGYHRLRHVAYDRAAGTCEGQVTDGCPRTLTRAAFEFHHRKLRSQGGDDTIENGVALCSTCHAWCHRWPRAARDLGLIVPRASDPAARPVRLPDGRIVRLTGDATYDVVFTADGEAAA